MAKVGYIQLRAGEEDKKRAQELADAYGVSISELVLLALNYIDQERPALTVTIKPTAKPKPKKGE